LEIIRQGTSSKDMRQGPFMYRCYLLSNGHIIWRQDLAASTIAEAIKSGHELRVMLSKNDEPLAMEIWQGTSLLYHDVCDTLLTHHSASIVSLFNTAPGAMCCAWEPTRFRSPATQAETGLRRCGPQPAVNDQEKR
jgi:hypothetical protein